MEDTILLTIEIAPDMEIRVRKITTDLRENALVEIREFIPSAQRWGRGIVLGVEAATQILHPDLLAKVEMT